MNPSPPPLPTSPPPAFNTLAFYLVLMLPAVLTLVAAGSGKANTEIPAAIGVCASGMAGLCCGIMLARRARALALKAAMFLAFSVLFGFVSLFLSFVGCALGEGLGRH